jgi:hypothetical protein
VAGGRGRDRDRDLGQRSRDRQENDPAERLAEVEAAVDDVGRLRERDPGDPGRDGGDGEDADELDRRERSDRPILRAGSDVRAQASGGRRSS